MNKKAAKTLNHTLTILLALGCLLSVLGQPVSQNVSNNNQTIQEEAPEKDQSGDERESDFNEVRVFYPVYKSASSEFSFQSILLGELTAIKHVTGNIIHFIHHDYHITATPYFQILFCFIISPNAP